MIETVIAVVTAMLAVFGAYCIVRLFISEMASPYPIAIEVDDLADAEGIADMLGEASLRFPDGRILLLLPDGSPAIDAAMTLELGNNVKLLRVTEVKCGGQRSARE